LRKRPVDGTRLIHEPSSERTSRTSNASWAHPPGCDGAVALGMQQDGQLSQTLLLAGGLGLVRCRAQWIENGTVDAASRSGERRLLHPRPRRSQIGPSINAASCARRRPAAWPAAVWRSGAARIRRGCLAPHQ
jgi:hypothetical protein